jgi:hypothetical protein
MELKASNHVATAINVFINDVGVPDKIVCDLATAQTGKHSEVMKLIRRFNIKMS